MPNVGGRVRVTCVPLSAILDGSTRIGGTMPQATCPKCQTAFQIPDQLTDQKAQCTGCGAWIRVGAGATATQTKPPVKQSDSRPSAPRLDPRHHRDACVEALEDVRDRIGKPGRDLSNPISGQAVARDASAMLADPVLGRLLNCEEFLIAHGQVVWAAVIDAEPIVYDKAFSSAEQPGLGTSIIATDPLYGHMLTPLVVCATALRQVSEQKEHADATVANFAQMQRKQWGTWHGLRAPLALTGSVPCTLMTIVYESKHLPSGVLGGRFYPALAHPLMPTAMVVPEIFWGRKMQMLWEQPLEAPSDSARKMWHSGAITRELISPASGHARMDFKGPVQQTQACLAFHEMVMVEGQEKLLVDGYFPNDPVAAAGELLRTACRAARTRSEHMKQRFDKLLPYVARFRGKQLVSAALDVARPIRDNIPKPKWKLFKRAPRPV